jgi:hypothetical protein
MGYVKKMATIITINTIISGTSPYDVWVCDKCGVLGTCQYINTIYSVPYSFTLPISFESMNTYVVKIIDSNGCEYCLDGLCNYKQFENLTCFEFEDGIPYDFQ